MIHALRPIPALGTIHLARTIHAAGMIHAVARRRCQDPGPGTDRSQPAAPGSPHDLDGALGVVKAREKTFGVRSGRWRPVREQVPDDLDRKGG